MNFTLTLNTHYRIGKEQLIDFIGVQNRSISDQPFTVINKFEQKLFIASANNLKLIKYCEKNLIVKILMISQNKITQTDFLEKVVFEFPPKNAQNLSHVYQATAKSNHF